MFSILTLSLTFYGTKIYYKSKTKIKTFHYYLLKLKTQYKILNVSDDVSKTCLAVKYVLRF